jgi:apolipoprotein N-acyltransferase
MMNKTIKKISIDITLTLAAAILFAASFPNPVIKYGIPLFAWFAYIPVLIVIQRYSLLSCAGWGALYGFLAYSLFNYWLGAFHPLAGTIVYSIYLVYMAAVFVLLKLASILFTKKAYLVQWLIWLAYEYLRTKGFLGYTYGITGYSQWQFIPLIQIASVAGVWGVSALVAFPSFWLAEAISNEKSNEQLTMNNEQWKRWRKIVGIIGRGFKREKSSALVWGVVLIGVLVFGFINMKDFSGYPQARIALIQHNTDPWAASKAPTPAQVHEAYRKDLTILKRLSDQALASVPAPQMVVWPETAFVPRIHWHYTYRRDQNFWLITRDLLGYLAAKDVPFLIGNDDARSEPAKNSNADENYRVDYNAALFFEKGEITGIYRKLHLVPFTEHFPYRKQLPFFYNWLLKADTHFWEKGEEATVFKGPGFNFSTPICFEDTFGYLSRNFVKRGADILVNISNDAWSNSLSAQYQHLSLAVFRSVEKQALNGPLHRLRAKLRH